MIGIGCQGWGGGDVKYDGGMGNREMRSRLNLQRMRK